MRTLFIVIMLGLAAFLLWRLGPRRKAQRPALDGPLAGVGDPVTAAAVIMAAIACEDEAMTADRQSAYRSLLEAIAGPEQLDAAAEFGRKTASEIDDAQYVIDKLGPFLAGKLDDQEKEELLHMAQEAAMSGGKLPAALTQRLMRLRQKLGLEIS